MGRAGKHRNEFSQWQDRLKRFEASGLSIDAFCRQEEIGRATFMDWLKTLRKDPARQATVEGETRSAKIPAFAPVTVNSHLIEILLPGGGRVRLSAGIERAVLLDVIRIVSTVLQESQS